MHRFFEIFRSKRKQKSLVIYALSLAIFLVWAAFFTFPGGNLRVWFLDVGQGDAAFIRTPRGNTVLVDGGPSERVLVKLGRVMPFWENTLDLLVISHWDADHITGLVGVLEKYKVANIVHPSFDCESLICQKVKELIDEEGARILVVRAGNRLKLGSTVLNVFWPPVGCNLGSNDCSVVLLLDWGRFEVLFTGDVQEKGQAGIAGKVNLSAVEVFKVPHHGADCLSPVFLNYLSPAVAVVSVGKNSYGHPTMRTLEKLKSTGSKIYRTDKEGTIKVVSDGRGWWVENRK